MTLPAQPTSVNSQFWDARFGEPGYAYGENPNDFLRLACQQIVPGEALSLCEGEGRNAVYLAKLGFRVTAADFSEVGLAKAKALAASQAVEITTMLIDLADLELGVARWDLVVSIFAQPPAATRQRLFHQLAQGLRLNGGFILEAKVEANGGPAGRYPGAAVLREEIAPLTSTIEDEQERQLNEGRYHASVQRTVRILAFNR